jgi:dTDP-4-dehydrorhamnose 3,5-epimerase-like enzyme
VHFDFDSVVDFPPLGDDRDSLVALEANKTIPFEIKHVYYLFNTEGRVTRGLHAHKALKQVMLCISGSYKVTLDDGRSRESISLSSRTKGLLIEGLIWREMCDFSADCALLVIASELYDENDYVRNYLDFEGLIGNA